jgi:hypothetical protein
VLFVRPRSHPSPEFYFHLQHQTPELSIDCTKPYRMSGLSTLPITVRPIISSPDTIEYPLSLSTTTQYSPVLPSTASWFPAFLNYTDRAIYLGTEINEGIPPFSNNSWTNKILKLPEYEGYSRFPTRTIEKEVKILNEAEEPTGTKGRESLKAWQIAVLVIVIVLGIIVFRACITCG